MNKEELIKELDKLGINPGYYSLDERSIEGMVLEHNINYYGNGKQYDEWRVFQQERGNRYDEDIFYDIEKAYQNIYERFKRDIKFYNKL